MDKIDNLITFSSGSNKTRGSEYGKIAQSLGKKDTKVRDDTSMKPEVK